jgi:hypothetical protein
LHALLLPCNSTLRSSCRVRTGALLLSPGCRRLRRRPRDARISSDFWGRFNLSDGTATAAVWEPERNRVRRELTAVPTVNADGTLTATFQVYVVLSKGRYPAVPPSITRTFLDTAARRSHQPELEMPGGADHHTYRYADCGYWLTSLRSLRYTKRRVRCYATVDWWYGNGRNTCTSYVHADYWPRSGRWRFKVSDCRREP